MRINAGAKQPGRQFTRALITGASRGIGAAFARALPPSTHVLLVARDQERLDELASELRSPGRQVETLSTDLADAAGVDAAIAAGKTFGPDLLINNAGIGWWGKVLDNAAAQEREMVMLNVVAVLRLCRELLPAMIMQAEEASARAGLINVSSAAAFTPIPFLATYAATKTFGLHFTEALAEELHDKPVDVLVLCPGFTRTGAAERGGFSASGFAGWTDPDRVARDGLAALGRNTVAVSGCLEHTALYPLVAPRRVFAGTLGAAMRRLAPWLIREQGVVGK